MFSLLVVSILTLVITVGPLLLGLRGTGLGRPIGPVLLALTLRVVGILPRASLRGTIALLLTRIALLSRILLLRWVALLLRGALLVGFLLLTILRTSLLWGPVGGHGSLAHHVVALVPLAHHAHGSLLALVVLATATRGHVILLRRWLLMHHRTLVGLHIHVWSWAVVAHGLSLAHVHLALGRHALRRGHGVIVSSHGAMAARRHVHGATRHIRGLVRSRTLHGHMVRTRHLSIHLAWHVWCWGTFSGHVVAMGNLGGRPTLIHATRHGHILGWRSRKKGLHVLIRVCYCGQIHQVPVKHLLVL